MDVPGEVLMIQAGEHLMLSLWATASSRPRWARSAEARAYRRSRWRTTCRPRGGRRGARHGQAAGADPVQAGAQREWGGYTGYFGDPDGFRWEIA